MNTKHLALFSHVSKVGSVTKAARDLYISQPALTMQLKRLEEEIGVPLLTPLGRGITRTDAGDTFLEYADQILALESQLLRAMEDYRAGMRGKLICGATDDVSTYILPVALKEFRKQHPHVSVELRTMRESDIEPAVHSGFIDIGIVQEASNHLSLRVTPFAQDAWIGIMPRVPVESANVFIPKSNELHCGSLPAFVILDSTEMVKRFVLCGLGYGVVLRSSVKLELAHDLLKPWGQVEESPVVYSTITRPAERLSKSVWLLLKHLQDNIRNKDV